MWPHEKQTLYLPVQEPAAGDGLRADLAEAEEDLAAGRYEECEAKLNCLESDADTQRLLLHCLRCRGRSNFALEAAREQRELFQEPLAQAKMLLSMAECHLACGAVPLALQAAKEAHEAFRQLDAPVLEGLALLLMAEAEPKTAAERCQEAIEAFQVDGGLRGLGRALLKLAESSRKACGKALEVFKFCGEQRWQAYTLQKMAFWSWEDDAKKATEHAEAALFLLENMKEATLPREAQLAELCCAAYARLGQPSVGLRALRSCLKRARDLGERRIEGHLLLGAVRATEALGHAGALQSCSAALKIFEELDDRRMQLACQLASSQVHLRASEAREALSSAQQAVALATCGEDQATAAAQLCMVRWSMGEMPQALEALERLLETLKRTPLASTQLRRAQLLLQMEQTQQAAQAATEALQLYRRLAPEKQGQALLVLAAAQLRTPQEALRTAQEASELFGRLNRPREQAEALLLISQAAQGCLSSSARSLQPEAACALQACRELQCLAEACDDPLLRARAHLSLAELQDRFEKLEEEALTNAKEAGDLFASLGCVAETALCHEMQASALRKLQHLSQEKEALEGAKELYELARVKEGARRCELRLRELKLQGETKAEAFSLATQPLVVSEPMPVALQKPQPREKRVPKDLSRLAGKELVEEQLMKIFEDLDVEDLELDFPLMQAGLTSRTAVQLRSELERSFGDLSLPATLVFDYPTTRGLAGFMHERMESVAAG